MYKTNSTKVFGGVAQLLAGVRAQLSRHSLSSLLGGDITAGFTCLDPNLSKLLSAAQVLATQCVGRH